MIVTSNILQHPGINLGYDMYFDNETIFNQFERLFQFLSFKTEYKGHDFEVIIDNTRTHSAKNSICMVFAKRSALDVQ